MSELTMEERKSLLDGDGYEKYLTSKYRPWWPLKVSEFLSLLSDNKNIVTQGSEKVI